MKAASAVQTARYRTVACWKRQRASYLVLVLLIGLAGGVALGSLAAARRTESSFPTFLAATNPSALMIEPAGGGPGIGQPHLAQRLEDAVRGYPQVKHVESYEALAASFVRSGKVQGRSLDGNVLLVSSVDGLLFNQDRLTVTSGRMANPSRANEVVVTQGAASALGLHLGQTITVTIDSGMPPGPAPAPAARRIALKVVGIGLLNREVVQDQIAQFPTYIVGTPALARSLASDPKTLVYLGAQLRGGTEDVAAVERRWNSTERYFTDFEVASQVQAEAQQAIRPEALALGVFGVLAALAALFLAIQVIARQLGAREQDLAVMRAVGADPVTTGLDGLPGIFASIMVGSVLAVGVALAMSPLFPIGPVRAVYPDRGVNADWTVLGAGFAILVGVLGMVALAIAFGEAPHRVQRRARGGFRRSSAVDLAARSGLPPSAVAGTTFAVDARSGRTAGPYRGALLAAVVAMIVVTATLTFGASLHTLVSQPALYGWNWDYAVESSNGYGPVPSTAVATLRHDPAVTASSGIWFATMQLDGVEVPTLLSNPGNPVAPPIISGHGLTSSHEIVLGAATLAALHKRIGDTVDLKYVPADPPHAIRLTIVGVATMPAIGIAEGLHTSMGIGAAVPADAGPVTETLGPQGYDPPCKGPNMVLLRVHGGPDAAQGRAAARRLTVAANDILTRQSSDSSCGGYQASVLAVQHPAQITNYRSMGTTPLLVAAGLALAAVVALGLALAASVRRCRRDLALLKVMGFVERQLAAAVAWHATITATIGVVIGVPLGIVLGRWLWTLFANEIGAVPAPTVPVWSILLAAVAALVLANVAAVLPGWRAGRTATALVLKDE
jgi:ABC-type lipoprotein release transport system permease subunit